MDEELIGLGLDIPFPVKMAKALRNRGISLKGPIYQKKNW